MTLPKSFKRAKNPMTGEYEDAAYVPNYFGLGIDGIWFGDGSIYNPAMIPIKIKDA